MKKTILGLVLCLVLVLSGCSSGMTGKAVKEDTLEIGFIGPLNGDAAVYGIPVQNSIDIAVNEINARGGVDGKKLKMLYENGECSPKVATQAANKLINVDNVEVILGGMCSGETLAIAPIGEAAQVLMFSSGSTSPDVTHAGDFVFRNVPSDAKAGEMMAELIFERYTKTAVIAENTDYSQAWADSFIEKYEELGGEVTKKESFDTLTKDFRSSILKVQDTDPEALLLVAQTTVKAGLLLKTLNELDVKLPKFGAEMFAGQDVLDAYQEDAEGLVVVKMIFDPKAPRAAKFLGTYEAQYGEECPWEDYCAAAYDAVYLLKEGIETVGHDSVALKDWLYTVEDWEGAIGSLTIDSNGDPVREYGASVIKNGKLVALE